MPDPSAVASVVEGVKQLAVPGAITGTVGATLKKVLGPSINVIADALARYTEYRTKNVGRIAEIADQRSDANGSTGDVHPRVAHRLLEEGSYCDDELMAQYLGGVLAASRTPDGRDDRAVTWSDLVTGLSALQLRAHYLIYRELVDLSSGRSDIQLGMSPGRREATLCVPLVGFLGLLAHASEQPFVSVEDSLKHAPEGDLLAHTIPNLVRLGLLGDQFQYGPEAPVGVSELRFTESLFVEPTFAGFELWGWAQGLPGLSAHEFSSKARIFDLDPPLPRLGQAYLPHDPLPATPNVDGSASTAVPN